jgi:hypothetical protein
MMLEDAEVDADDVGAADDEDEDAETDADDAGDEDDDGTYDGGMMWDLYDMLEMSATDAMKSKKRKMAYEDDEDGENYGLIGDPITGNWQSQKRRK